MKNVHIISTPGVPSRIRYSNQYDGLSNYLLSKESLNWRQASHVYITTDERIVPGDAYLCPRTKKAFIYKGEGSLLIESKKIVLTTDDRLINQGVQELDGDVLDWIFSCGTKEHVFVSVIPEYEDHPELVGNPRNKWSVYIPKKVEKKEKLKPVTKYYSVTGGTLHGPIALDKIASESSVKDVMFTQEQLLEHLNLLYAMKNSTVDTFTDREDKITSKWFEQFK